MEALSPFDKTGHSHPSIRCSNPATQVSGVIPNLRILRLTGDLSHLRLQFFIHWHCTSSRDTTIVDRWANRYMLSLSQLLTREGKTCHATDSTARASGARRKLLLVTRPLSPAWETVVTVQAGISRYLYIYPSPPLRRLQITIVWNGAIFAVVFWWGGTAHIYHSVNRSHSNKHLYRTCAPAPGYHYSFSVGSRVVTLPFVKWQC